MSHVSCACSWPRMDSYACLPLVAVSLISSMVCTEADLVSSKDDIRLTTGFSLTCLGTLLGSQERIRRASCACSWPQMCFMMITNYVCLSLAAHVTHRLGRNVPNQHEIYVQYMHICQWLFIFCLSLSISERNCNAQGTAATHRHLQGNPCVRSATNGLTERSHSCFHSAFLREFRMASLAGLK